MRSKLFLLLIFVGACSINVKANGGPYDGSSIYKSGDPHFIRMENVELVSEKLDMKIDGDFTHVSVTYRLLNLSAKPTGNIHYGFPVEFYPYRDCCGDGWDKRYISNLTFRFNGKLLKSVVSDTIVNVLEEKEVDGNYYEERRQRKWFYTEFSIKENDLVTLQVDYTIMNSFEDWGTSKSAFSGHSERQLHYDFSPASYWGSGIVKDFQVNIDTRSVLEADSLKIEGLDFNVENGIYSYSKTNFALKDAKPLILRYDISLMLLSDCVRSNRIPNNEILSIKASSTLSANYDVRNLLDSDLNTAWVAGKKNSGIGESIELEISNRFNVSGIVLTNGYTKSQKSYTDNNRIKKLRLEIDKEYGSTEIDLEDRAYQHIDLNNFMALSDIVLDTGDGALGVSKIKITILDVYKGTTYDDTCISELFVFGYKLDCFDYTGGE
ncbi:hypothetical protein LJC00_00160 [Dysgonomonas sp. OttesenSCG-928-M03]|nr:hypothetical protein [Dysgonomonas sp. OttesenSCG-928-M03]